MHHTTKELLERLIGSGDVGLTAAYALPEPLCGRVAATATLFQAAELVLCSRWSKRLKGYEWERLSGVLEPGHGASASVLAERMMVMPMGLERRQQRLFAHFAEAVAILEKTPILEADGQPADDRWLPRVRGRLDPIGGWIEAADHTGQLRLAASADVRRYCFELGGLRWRSITEILIQGDHQPRRGEVRSATRPDKASRGISVQPLPDTARPNGIRPAIGGKDGNSSQDNGSHGKGLGGGPAASEEPVSKQPESEPTPDSGPGLEPLREVLVDLAVDVGQWTQLLKLLEPVPRGKVPGVQQVGFHGVGGLLPWISRHRRAAREYQRCLECSRIPGVRNFGRRLVLELESRLTDLCRGERPRHRATTGSWTTSEAWGSSGSSFGSAFGASSAFGK